jgi:hypothetical protein
MIVKRPHRTSAAFIYLGHTSDSVNQFPVNARPLSSRGNMCALSQPHVWILPRLRIFLAKSFGAEPALSGNFGPA